MILHGFIDDAVAADVFDEAPGTGADGMPFSRFNTAHSGATAIP
jgi:hypothetical protein